MAQAAERFVTPCALPNEHERELLTILIEECAEVQQRATKLLRFGRDEIQPGQPLKNSQRLGREIGDVYVMADLAIEAGLLTEGDIAIGKHNKRAQLARFMQTIR